MSCEASTGRELAEAREQQAATAQILRVIPGSPTDLKRAFSEIAGKGSTFQMELPTRAEMRKTAP
jgi:hypothetical protein